MDKTLFLDQTHSLILEAHIDGNDFVVSGEDLNFKSYVDVNFDSKMIKLSEYYSDVNTLFVIFAIDFKLTPLPNNIHLDREFPNSVEWRIVNTSGKEVDSHFSYQLPGDGTFFTTKANRAVSWRNPTLRSGSKQKQEKPERPANPVMFLSNDGRIARIPCIYLPENCNSVGLFAVQESEAIINLNDSVGQSIYTVTPEFLYDLSARIVDRRKQNYLETSEYSTTIENHVVLYMRHTDRFSLPLLCRTGG
jgi:hypothetical protein